MIVHMGAPWAAFGLVLGAILRSQVTATAER